MLTVNRFVATNITAIDDSYTLDIDDSYTLDIDAETSLVLDVLTNDVGDGVQIFDVSSTLNASITISTSNTSISFTSDVDFADQVSFSYSIVDSTVLTDTASVHVAVLSDLDTGADGMANAWEVMVFGSIDASDGTSDMNNNGINGLLEYHNSLTQPVSATGDVNDDGVVDIRDLLKVQRHTLSIQLLTPDEIARANLYTSNGDSLITISDVLGYKILFLMFLLLKPIRMVICYLMTGK